MEKEYEQSESEKRQDLDFNSYDENGNVIEEKESECLPRVHQELNLAPNYRLTIASDETVARIYLETKKKKVSPQNIKTVIEILRDRS